MNNWKCFAFIKIVERATGIQVYLHTNIHRFFTVNSLINSDKEQGAYELRNKLLFWIFISLRINIKDCSQPCYTCARTEPYSITPHTLNISFFHQHSMCILNNIQISSKPFLPKRINNSKKKTRRKKRTSE